MGRLKKVAMIKSGNGDVEVWSDIQSLRKQLKRFSGDGINRANMRALNRAANKTRTRTVSLLSKAFNIKAGDLKPFVKVSPRATLRKGTVAIMGRSTRPLGIHKFAKGAKKQGVLGVRFNAGGGSKTHPHTFIARMPSGHVGIFVRKTRRRTRRDVRVSPTTGKKYRTHLSIRELTYPSVAHMITNVQRGQEIFNVFVADYPRQLFSQLDFELKKSKGVA